jgi:hypothetical protein
MSLIKSITMNALRREAALWVIDMSVIDKRTKPERVEKKVEDISSAGLECLRPAMLEGERRYCGNDTEEVNIVAQPVDISDRELLASILDMRIIKSNHLWGEQLTRARKVFGEAYVAFGMQYRLYEREQEAAREAAAASKLAKDSA